MPLFFTERGSGPPLLLVHGLMVTGEMFEPILPALAQHHRVIVPDLRGHGRSRELPAPYSVAQLAEDLSLLLDSLGITSAHVLGYSQGGAIAQQLALTDPKRVEGLTLVCTYAFNGATLSEKLEGRVTPLLIRTLGMKRFARLVVSQGLKGLTPERAVWVAEMIGGQDPRLMAAAWREASAFDGRSRLAQLRCPTLIIAGSRDDAVPLHHARQLHQGIAGSRLEVVDGAGHDLVWTHPAALLALLDPLRR